MTPASVACLSVFYLLVLLLPAPHGATRRVFFRRPDTSSGDSQQTSTVPTATTCSSSITNGLDDNMLPILHRENLCSPLHGLSSLTAADVLRRDASFIRRRFSSESSSVALLAPSPAATTIPVNGSFELLTLPGAMDYSVLVNYGTPEQQFPAFLDTSIGTSLLRCKPCISGSDGCDPAFDTSQSNTFAHIPCGSPDCPANCSGTSLCSFSNSQLNIKGAFAEDVLTLAPSMAVDHFRFVSVDVDGPSDLLEAGTLDLSHDKNSVRSRLSPTSFSYCLPSSSNSVGFLYLGGNATAKENNLTIHAPLVWNKDPDLAGMYFIDLVGIRVGDEDLPIQVGTFGGNDNASANLAVMTTFTMLAPEIYTLLRDSFVRQMSQYSNFSSPGIDGFDTCFNFTGLHELTLPLVEFKFGNAENLLIDSQMLYYHNPHVDHHPFTMVCLAFSALDASNVLSAVIGAYTLASMEVVYDVAGGKVGFIPSRC